MTKIKFTKDLKRLKQEKMTCKDKMFLHPDGSFLGVFDIILLFIIGYSCITSAYYITFHMTENYILLRIEDITYIAFACDIILNFLRVF